MGHIQELREMLEEMLYIVKVNNYLYNKYRVAFIAEDENLKISKKPPSILNLPM